MRHYLLYHAGINIGGFAPHQASQILAEIYGGVGCSPSQSPGATDNPCSRPEGQPTGRSGRIAGHNRIVCRRNRDWVGGGSGICGLGGAESPPNPTVQEGSPAL